MFRKFSMQSIGRRVISKVQNGATCHYVAIVRKQKYHLILRILKTIIFEVVICQNCFARFSLATI